MTAFPATRAEALRRLEDFLPRAGRAYAADRNTDFGPDRRGNVSVLSPYLRHRILTEREVIAAVFDAHGPKAGEKFVQEVLWRTYWKGWLEMRPAVWTRFLAERDAARSGGFDQAVAAAEAGETGIDGFDDWAKELSATGYLHNHARMWFASIWIFTLRLPWTLGADFFLRHLLDADPASNTLSWRWVAGLQTAGKTYLATEENIARYTDGRFSPRGLATSAEALYEEPVPAPRPIGPAERMPEGPSLLLLTGEDLAPESVVGREMPIAAILAAGIVDRPEPWPFGKAASSFAEAALADAAMRAKNRFGTAATIGARLDAETVAAAAKAAGAKVVVTAHAPVGPTADALAELGSTLAAAGRSLVRLRRDWDSRFWPLATKGFFAFREKSAAVLGEEGLQVDDAANRK